MDRTTTGKRIGCYLPEQEAKRLAEYAEEHGLSRSRLCTLLVKREVNCKRLGELQDRFEGSVGKVLGVRVTTHTMPPECRKTFSRDLKKAGLGRDNAVAILFRAELEEQWLAKALSSTGNRS